MRLHQRLVSIFGGIRKAVATHLDEQAINAACREEKYTWRERLFNPTNTVHLFILQILNRNTALNDLPRKSHESFTGSAFCKARQRLPLRVFQRLLRSLAETLLPHPGGERIDKEGRWCGHRTFIMDGSSCSMPDTPELCNGTSVSQATSVRAAVSQWPTCWSSFTPARACCARS